MSELYFDHVTPISAFSLDEKVAWYYDVSLLVLLICTPIV